MEEFYRKIYLFRPTRVEPIKIARDSQLKITVELMDYTVPSGSTARAFATGSFGGAVYTQACTVSGNKLSFTPTPGFFVDGKNILQFELNSGVIPLAIDVNCEISLPDAGDATEPEAVKPYVQRAEAAAQNADAAAQNANASATSAAESLSDAITAKNQAGSAAEQAIFAKKACQDSATAAADAADAAADSAAEIQGAASQIQTNADAIQHISIAYDMMSTINQAELRSAQNRIAMLEQQISALTAN